MIKFKFNCPRCDYDPYVIPITNDAFTNIICNYCNMKYYYDNINNIVTYNIFLKYFYWNCCLYRKKNYNK
jgi:transcription elongation factor Elf1